MYLLRQSGKERLVVFLSIRMRKYESAAVWHISDELIGMYETARWGIVPPIRLLMGDHDTCVMRSTKVEGAIPK